MKSDPYVRERLGRGAGEVALDMVGGWVETKSKEASHDKNTGRYILCKSVGCFCRETPCIPYLGKARRPKNRILLKVRQAVCAPCVKGCWKEF